MNMSWVALNNILEESKKGTPMFLKNRGKPVLREIRKLTDAMLIKKLDEVGIGYSHEQMDAWSKMYASVEALTLDLDEHHPLRDGKENRFDIDWRWCCLTVLWERHFSDRPCLERIDCLVQEAYRLTRKDTSSGFDLVFQAWEMVCVLAKREGIATVAEFDEAFPCTQFLSNWIQDFAMDMGNAVVDDNSLSEKAIQYGEGVLQTFPRDGELMHCFLGEIYLLSGDCDKADEQFESNVELAPRDGWKWISWASAYGILVQHKDYEKAESILRRALKIEGLENRADVLGRMKDFYQEQGKDCDEHAEDIGESETIEEANMGIAKIVSRGGTFVKGSPKIGRNDPCPCGSGKKYKKCCLVAK